MRQKIPWNILLPYSLAIFLAMFVILAFNKYFFGKEIINKNLNNCICEKKEKYTIYPNIKFCDCILLKDGNSYKYYSIKDICKNSRLKNLIDDCYLNYEVLKCGGIPKDYYIKYEDCINKCCK